jgi:hypothetical protein
MSETCLNQTELARRWQVSPRTLERWRWLSQGPRYLKLGGRVLYRVSDIEAYERSVIRLTEADAAGSWADGASRGATNETDFISRLPQLITAKRNGLDSGRGAEKP